MSKNHVELVNNPIILTLFIFPIFFILAGSSVVNSPKLAFNPLLGCGRSGEPWAAFAAFFASRFFFSFRAFLESCAGKNKVHIHDKILKHLC